MTGMLIRSKILTSSDKAEMYRLLKTQFDGLDPLIFQKDLENKNWVLLVRSDKDGVLEGFTTLAHYQRCFEGKKIDVICSGDTVLAHSRSEKRSLAHYWIPAIEHLRAKHVRSPLYWLLISSGYRTYRFLPVFLKCFQPCHDKLMPAATRRLIDFLATDRFGEEYCSANGIVRFRRPQVLKPSLQGIPPERLSDPHVAFFLSANPGYIDGDELVCLASLEHANYTAAAARLMERAGSPACALRIFT